jgi:hypothetical protein
MTPDYLAADIERYRGLVAFHKRCIEELPVEKKATEALAMVFADLVVKSLQAYAHQLAVRIEARP